MKPREERVALPASTGGDTSWSRAPMQDESRAKAAVNNQERLPDNDAVATTQPQLPRGGSREVNLRQWRGPAKQPLQRGTIGIRTE